MVFAEFAHQQVISLGQLRACAHQLGNFANLSLSGWPPLCNNRVPSTGPEGTRWLHCAALVQPLHPEPCYPRPLSGAGCENWEAAGPQRGRGRPRMGTGVPPTLLAAPKGGLGPVSPGLSVPSLKCCNKCLPILLHKTVSNERKLLSRYKGMEFYS